MAASPCSKSLYRITRRFVIFAAFALAFATLAPAQSSTQKKDLGPRALALLQLAPDGSSRLVPIAIMYNGDFFDASAYKADPVPMALDSGTVYEAFRTGSSQGLFTIKEAVRAGTLWSARGTWQDSAALAAIAAARKKKKAEKPPTIADEDKGPPKLLRRSTSGKTDSPTASSGNKPASTENQPPPDSDSDPDRPQLKRPQQSAPASTPSTPSAQTPAPSQPQASQSQPQSAGAKPATPPATAQAKPDASEVSDEDDPNRPRLERGKSALQAKSDPFSVDAVAPAKSPTASPASASKNPTTASAMPAPNIQEIPAISDAGGPEAHSYTFPLKAGEEEQFRKKMLAQATQVIRTQLKEKTSEDTARTSAKTTKAKSAMRLPEPTYQDVKLRIFDLSSSNQPIMVLEANVQVPGRDEQQHITLVARQDLYGELHNSLANLTDMKHLDVAPQMDLIDVVDADGDGRAELFFRETSDQGHAYSIYRVIGDQLYQLYESTPQ